MKEFVLDASALLAVILNEPGAERVQPRITSSAMSMVNVSETFARSAQRGVPENALLSFIVSEQIELIEFDIGLAMAAARLRPATKQHGLSFADRACIALGIRNGATILTADRVWSTLDLPCKVELIR